MSYSCIINVIMRRYSQSTCSLKISGCFSNIAPQILFLLQTNSFIINFYGINKNAFCGGISLFAAIPISSPFFPNTTGKSTAGCLTPLSYSHFSKSLYSCFSYNFLVNSTLIIVWVSMSYCLSFGILWDLILPSPKIESTTLSLSIF